jgi:hypothetical protein
MGGAWPTRAILACSAFLVLAAPAHASTQIGAVADSDPNNCPPNWEFIQGAVPSGGPSYDVPAGGGVITSWKTQAGTNVGVGLRLKVYRPTAASDTWTLVAETPLKVLTPNTLNTVPTRISVQSGDRIALRTASENGGPCWFPDAADLSSDYHALGYTPLSPPGFDPPAGSDVTFNNDDRQALVNIAAVVEPDADGDGFGDETQDQCPGVPGSSNGCPPPPAPGPTPTEPQVPLAPQLHVSAAAKRTQHVLKQHGIVLTVRPSVASTVTGTATLSLPRGAAVIRFKRASKQVAANAKVTLKLALSKAQLKRVKAALRHHKLTAKAVLTTTVSGQKPSVKRFSIRLRS